MKKRLHDKKAGIAILAVLFITSLAQVISRVLIMEKSLFTTSDCGEYLIVALFALFMLIMSVKGKDRTCYLGYGVLLAYFVLDQLFELPGMIAKFIPLMRVGWAGTMDYVAFVFNMLGMVGIIGIGVLVFEYMTDGTIYNKAFNGFCFFTVFVLTGSMIINVFSLVNGATIELVHTIFYNISRITMVFLFAFFAYDSAKMQLKKANLSK